MKFSTVQIQKPILAPSLQQSIAILLLPLLELNTAIEQELQNNPLLELDETHPDYLAKRDKEIYQDLDRWNKAGDTPIYEDRAHDEEESSEARPIVKTVSLEEDLLRQLRLEYSDPFNLQIGEFIIGNLNEDGYLKISCEEIAASLEVELEIVEEMLYTIQNFEPIGIASRDLKECLLIQIQKITHPDKDHALKIIESYLAELGRKKYLEIGRKLGISIEEVKAAGQLIATLEPKPARNYRPLDSSIYIKPDVVVYKDENDVYQILINQSEIPPLRINPTYRQLLKNEHTSEADKAFVREKLTNAMNFIKSITQRGQTIRKITEYLLDRQRDFFENGDPTMVVPMNLKDVAVAVERCESTISRAINNKYIDTPFGLYPMKFFLSQAINNTTDNCQVSAKSIQEELKDIIEHEDKISPLSDQDIQNYFKKKGLTLARRTVSKYRQALQIPPSYLRKE